MKHVHLDFETRSELSVKEVGSHVYANHPSTEIMCLAYAVDKGPVKLITEHDFNAYYSGDTYDPEHSEIVELYQLALDKNTIFIAHNRFFEGCVWDAIMQAKYNFPYIPIERWRCTAAKAAQRSLPRKLEKAGLALKLPVQKDMTGNNVMMQLSRPRNRVSANNPFRFWTSEAAPEKFAKLYEYNKDDVRVERYLDQWLPDMPQGELEIWFMDQRMNTRGLKLDLEFVESAVKLLEQAKGIALRKFAEAVEDELKSPLQRDKFKTWLLEQGLFLPNLQGATLDEELEKHSRVHHLADNVLEALKMAKLLGRSSTKKFQAMLDRVSRDGRLRDYLMYYGADRTGRWSGRGVQPHNMLRPPKNFDIETVIAVIKMCDYDLMEFMYGDVISAIAYATRGAIIATEGYEIFVSDFSGIESRVLAWLAGQEDLLQLFRDYDAKLIPTDNYCQLASSITGRGITKDDDNERQMGKVGELALGFGGGINAFVTMAVTYRLNLETLFPLVWPTATAIEKVKAKKAYKHYRKGREDAISPRAGCAVDVIKQRYRSSRDSIAKFWKDLEKAAIKCVNDGGTQFVGCITFKLEGTGDTLFLRMHLPSGRALSYHLPKVKHEETFYGVKETLSYMEMNEKNQYVKVSTYGGKLAENATQAVARDLMAYSFLRIEKAGYWPLLSVHDEAVSEREKGKGCLDEYNALMRETPGWAKGLPVDVAGWVGERYKKG